MSAARDAMTSSSRSGTPAKSGTVFSSSAVIMPRASRFVRPRCSQESRRTVWHLVEKRLVDEAPAPRLARLERPKDRMMRLAKMCARVLVLRIVATADVPAAQAQAQMNPVVAIAQALLAAVGARRHGTNLVEMRATVHWRFSAVIDILAVPRAIDIPVMQRSLLVRAPVSRLENGMPNQRTLARELVVVMKPGVGLRVKPTEISSLAGVDVSHLSQTI